MIAFSLLTFSLLTSTLTNILGQTIYLNPSSLTSITIAATLRLPFFSQQIKYYCLIIQKFYRENINFEKLKFDDRIQNSQEKNIMHVNFIKSQANYRFQPPSNYCQLCKLSFQDYSTHTSSQQHLDQITASRANIYISQLAHKFAAFPTKTQKITKKSKNEKTKRM